MDYDCDYCAVKEKVKLQVQEILQAIEAKQPTTARDTVTVPVS